MPCKQYDPENVFAKILREELPCFKVYEDEHTFAFMDVMPEDNGHTLIIPKTYARNLLDVDQKTWLFMAETTQKIAHAMMHVFQPDGISVRQSSEEAAGQVVFHIHIHIIPRYNKNIHDKSNLNNPSILSKNAEKMRLFLQ